MTVKVDSPTGSFQMTKQASPALPAEAGLIRLDATNEGALRITNDAGVSTVFDSTLNESIAELQADIGELQADTVANSALISANTAQIDDLAEQAGDIPEITIDRQYFASSGTWTKPAGAFLHRVIVVAGGSGGGSGRRGAASSARSGGGGGAAGSVTDLLYTTGELGATETIVVGAGGLGGAAITSDSTNGNPGASGENSYFGGTTSANCKQMAIAFAEAPVISGTIGGGKGGTTSTVIGGVALYTSHVSVQFAGSSGGNGRSNANSSPANSASYGPGGGGGGAGLSTGNTNYVGGNGAGTAGARFRPIEAGTGGTAVAGAVGGNGADGITDGSSPNMFGSGGGGGSAAASVGRAGGNGGVPGGGGGGGSASVNGNPSGAGGNGAPGGVWVISWCRS